MKEVTAMNIDVVDVRLDERKLPYLVSETVAEYRGEYVGEQQLKVNSPEEKAISPPRYPCVLGIQRGICWRATAESKFPGEGCKCAEQCFSHERLFGRKTVCDVLICKSSCDSLRRSQPRSN